MRNFILPMSVGVVLVLVLACGGKGTSPTAPGIAVVPDPHQPMPASEIAKLPVDSRLRPVATSIRLGLTTPEQVEQIAFDDGHVTSGTEKGQTSTTLSLYEHYADAKCVVLEVEHSEDTVIEAFAYVLDEECLF